MQFKLQAFSPSQFWYKQVSKLQRHMVARSLGQHRLAWEFFQRVSRAVSEHIGKSVSDWAVEWRKTTLSWDAHCSRDSVEQQRFLAANPNFGDVDFKPSPGFDVVHEHFNTSFSWAARLSQHMCADYFEQRRTVELSRARTHTRTGTRSIVGCVTPRYHDCVAFAQSELARLNIM